MAAAINPQRGRNRWNAKLSDEDVTLIRALIAERERLLAEARKLTDKKIADKFGVHRNTIWKAAKYESWKHASSIAQQTG